MIIAVDFDGTLMDGNGAPNYVMFRRLKNEQRQGNAVILWSCRSGERLKEALQFCARYGLVFNAVNDNVPETLARLRCNPRKIYADVYIDDKAVSP